MDILIQAGQLVLSLSFLIVLHELGHFIPAKLFKTRVEKFYLFFDPWFSLFKTKKGETEYGIGWLPLGGYVKISGMIDESMDKEQMAQEPQPWEFRSKPVWQRLIIMIGGVTVNLILGFLIYIMIMGVWGKDELRPEHLTHGYAVPELFEKYGFQDGDVILSVDGEELTDAMSVNSMLMLKNAQDFEVRHRDGTTEPISLPDDIDFQAFEAGAAFVPRVPAKIDSIITDSPAEKAGIQKGDYIVEINGTPIEYWDETYEIIKSEYDSITRPVLNKFLAENEGNYLDGMLKFMSDYKRQSKITVNRNGELLNLVVDVNHNSAIGIMPYTKMDQFTITHVDYSFFESIPAGWNLAGETLSGYVAQLKYLGTEKGASSVGGFGTFGKLFATEWDWHVFWERTALISIILAFMNILPIPALDGGHVMFLLYEMIAGKPANQKVMEYAQLIGFVLILALVIYANANDVIRAL